MTTIAKIGSATFENMGDLSDAIVDGQTATIVRDGNLQEATATFGKPGSFKILGLQNPTKLIKLHTDASIRPAWGKGILNLEQGNHEVAYLNLDGCAVDDSNGAGIRINPGVDSAYIHHCLLTNNENGILTGIHTKLRIEDTVFDRNGKASDPNSEGYTHNLYAGELEELIVSRTSFLNSEFGHDLKSRAKKTVLTQVLCEGSDHSREFDLSNGGILDAKDCKFVKRASADMNNLIDIGAEGVGDREESYTMTNCHFHNDVDPARDVQYINHRGKKELVLVDPLFTGAAATKDRAKTIVGNVRIVLTGGPLGPRVTPGGNPLGGEVQPTQIPVPTPAPAPLPPPVGGSWVKIGMENDTVTVAPNTKVRYGADVRWVEKVMSGTFQASNAVFGDPAKSITKSIEKFVPRPVVAPTPDPIPTQVPAPAPTPVPSPAPAPSAGTRYQEAKVGDVMASFAKSIATPAGETVASTDWFFDAAKGVVVFKLTITKP